MPTQYYCPNDARRRLVREHDTLNGIDYLEVIDRDAPTPGLRQRTLLVRCFKPLPDLGRENVRVSPVLGGERQPRPVRIEWARRLPDVLAAPPGELIDDGERPYFESFPASEADRLLVVRTDSYGDYSPYRLTLTKSASELEPPDDFDPRLSGVEFSFKVECPSDFDCAPDTTCPPEKLAQPHIDYLAKDYASFRRLLLDRLALTLPEWRERNVADLGIAAVEILAYAADHLSYYQDAVATEAYLGTARKRTSVRRHARLLDYPMHEGCNARAWVCLEVGADLGGATPVLPKSTRLLTRIEGMPAQLDPDRLLEFLSHNPIVFETLHDVDMLKASRNEIRFHTWGDDDCCLVKGATRATLRGSAADLALKSGDVLVFEEVRGPESGLAADADPAHRHAVRLNQSPTLTSDPLDPAAELVEVSWHPQDALPFPLCLREVDEGGTRQPVSVARGNVVLADHGLTVTNAKLSPDAVPERGRCRPQLQCPDITHAIPYSEELEARPASEATSQDPRHALPAVDLLDNSEPWTPQHDLLATDPFRAEFVVETETDGRAFLRFGGAGGLGRAPEAGTRFDVECRTGNGAIGNVGARVIAHVLMKESAIKAVYNPLPARGGTDPEPISRVKLDAPQAFRKQERAVTTEDYARTAERHPEVHKAVATLRWTGSWYTMFVTADRVAGRPVDAAFEEELRRFLETFRLAGHDLEIDAPRFVGLDIALTVCVKPGYFRSAVKTELLETFSNADLPDGRRGFFHPDNYTFGQPVFLSRVVAAAMQVPGVDWVDVDDTEPKRNRFQRWGQSAEGEVDSGRIELARLEIARLDNDPSFPENGTIEFFMEGGP